MVATPNTILSNGNKKQRQYLIPSFFLVTSHGTYSSMINKITTISRYSE